MTSLAYQLKRLALPQNDPNLLSRKEVSSLLFDPKEAATLDRSTFYAIGCTGLEELLGIEPAFQEFQDSLFSRASLTLERSVQSKDVNKKLDADISLFLTRLSPYFLLKPAHKCIEWLVHRFHIQLYNVDSLLACVLPYHHTNTFVRVIQLLKIKDATNRWNWLQCLQKPGVPLAKGTLVTHCYSDLSFMDFICNLVTTSIQAYSGHSQSFSQLRVIFSFYASTIVSALDSVDKVSETIVAKLLPYIQMGLKSELADYKAATYMIVCQMAVKVVMNASLVDTLAVRISKSVLKEPLLAKEGLGCLIVLLQRQKDGAGGSRFCRHVCSMPALASTLQLMAVTHDVSPLLRYLLPHLVQQVFANTDDASVLESLLEYVPLTNGLEGKVARLLLDEYMSQTELSEDNISTLNQRLQPLVRLFESKYCSTLDSVLTGHVTDLSNSDQKGLFHHFLSLSISSGKFQIVGDSDTSLLLSLKHPQPSLRISALKQLRSIVVAGQLQSLDQDFQKDAFIECLKDEVPDVVHATLDILEISFYIPDSEALVSNLLSLLYRIDQPEADSWLPVLTRTKNVLTSSRLENWSAEQVDKINWGLLPFLVITTTRPESAQLQLAREIARCDIFARHPLTLTWNEELHKVMKQSYKDDMVGLANQRLVMTLRKNLAKMEHLAKRDALEKLRLLGEEQRVHGVRGATFFMVVMETLLLGLEQLGETEHLFTAQQVFAVLEPSLLKVVKTHDVQEVFPSVLPASFSEALTSYLSRCDQEPTGQHESEYSQVLIWFLRDFIASLRCHDDNFKAAMWWNPEKLDVNTCCYLGLLSRLLAVIIEGASEGPTAGSFRDIMKLLVKVHLSNVTMLFRFLCMIWGYSSNNGDQLGFKVDAVLQTQALYVGGALLSAQPAKTLAGLAGADSPVVPSLLCCLASPVREVRRAALSALQSLSGVGASAFLPIVEKLLSTSEEIVADQSYLSTALGGLHEASESSKKNSPLKASMRKLLLSVQTPCCPSYTASDLLRALSHVKGQAVLSDLLPVLDRLLNNTPDTSTLLLDETLLLQLVLGKYNESAAPLLAADQNCLDLFIRAMKTTTTAFPGVPSCQILALEQITKPFFSAVGDEKVQQKLLTVMFDVLVDNNTLVASAVGNAFKVIAVDGQLVANELTPSEKAKVAVTVQQTRRSRMQRKAEESTDVSLDAGTVSWHRVTLILELLQHKKKLKRAQMLVPVLFSLLDRSLEASSVEKANMEYTKQLLLGCLLNVCNKLAPEGKLSGPDVLDEDKFSVELVVQCIRATDVPQTHHHALLLLGTVANIFPEKVLHNIMPIFTFMGANIMRLDDAYSFRVIDKTVQMIIPALIKAHSQSDRGLDTAVTRIVHVFVDALPHVPEHRRLPILDQLVTTLGPARFLWVLMLLLFKLHSTQATNFDSEKEAALERDMDFWISVCCQFEVADQIKALINIMNFLIQLPNDKDDGATKPTVSQRGAAKKKGEEEKVEDVIFGVEAHSGKVLRHFKFLSVSFMAQLLGSGSFIEKVADTQDVIDDVQAESLQRLQQQLLEDNLHYIQCVARCVEENADKPIAKFWRVLLNKSYDVLDKVNALLPTDTFITVMRGLMGNQLPSVRRKAMELLNNKLQHKTQWAEQQIRVLLELIVDLLAIVGPPQGENAEEASEQAVNRQTALYSLKLLCRLFGATHREEFLPVLLRAVEIVMSPNEEKNVTASSLLCVAEVVGALKALAIPQLPRLMPAVLQVLTDRKDLLTNEIYLLSAVTALQRIAETLAHFISPYLQDTTLQVCRLTRLLQDSPTSSSSSSSATSQLSVRLTSLRSSLAIKLPPRVLLPVITGCYSVLVADKQDQLEALMSILKEHLGNMEREQLSFHQSELTDFFLTALDFRAQFCQGNLSRTAQIEGGAIDCLLVMVMKLSEVTFRPLFFKLVDWSKSGKKDRLLTFFRMCDRIAERLKGLFVLFAGNLVKPFADLLQQINVAKTAEPLFDSKRGVEKSDLLLGFVLDCLHKIFLYDTQRFLSKERADALMAPLVDQLENTLGGNEAYQQRVTKHLLPCLAQFAVALADDTQWKSLNYQVLLKSRHADAKVRFSSLLMLTELAGKLKENYMVLLPETVPFLAELMEDECEEVEKQVQKAVQEMENILGESLQSYF
ncbi:HEAT repeat-containing protein 1 isoform X2 [Corythoichthys intestinalis]|uniref:HEAT repeat-containing protein 1 isoform X2 n=1 Tax=Corythoichthys intestinalis TaxID=161448 RepID=UPI0025A5D504|nr:HEAT repeat-containing protein 1 isoform X2 [Corythoichthys intestinalis]XP_061807615.1 HEAT repeat-containing protein 1-like [Nerophis lumbriciformis]